MVLYQTWLFDSSFKPRGEKKAVCKLDKIIFLFVTRSIITSQVCSKYDKKYLLAYLSDMNAYFYNYTKSFKQKFNVLWDQ